MATAPARPTLVLDRVTVAYGSRVACDAVSLGVAPGCIYALLGRGGAGKTSLLAALSGDRKPTGGRALFDGLDTWSDRRKLREWLCRVIPSRRSTPEETLDHALSRAPRLLLLDEFDFGNDPIRRASLATRLRNAATSGVTAVLATPRARDAEGLADRIGILRAGRLRLDEDAGTIAEQFRTIRYKSELTETRTEFGNELDLFEAVQVRVRGWGVEAIVSNFSADLFERFRETDGVVGAEALPLSVEKVFEAVSPAPSGAPEENPTQKHRSGWGWRRR